MIDRNPLSDAFGCFDREYWHYRTVDFACAMNQEFCLALATAWALEMPNNPFFGKDRLRDLVIGSIEFARKTTHADGSCDDYFPFERALGAHVFTTYTMSESYKVLGLNRPDLIDFFRLRGDWLLSNNESGQLANHQALAALALYNVYSLTEDPRYLEGSNHFRDLTLSWQNEEGWFQEYEGADPGYHSCSIDFLGKLRQKSNEDQLIEPLSKAVDFAGYFMHPDGSYAGEYGSRNTYHFYPHGFELMAKHNPTAGRIAETFLHKGLPERRRYYNDDNRMCAHYVYDWMQAWRDYDPDRHGLLEDSRSSFTKWFPDARMFVKKTARYYAVTSLLKGGVIKVYDDDGVICSDTGIMLETESGEVLVSHLVNDYAVEVDEAAGRLVVSGTLAFRRHQLSSPGKQMAFRAMNVTVGRFGADLVRKTLQKVLITGKPQSDVRFRRVIDLSDGQVTIRDEIDARESKARFTRMFVGSDATSIYVANSNTFQESMLVPWQDLTDQVARLNEDRTITLAPRLAIDST